MKKKGASDKRKVMLIIRDGWGYSKKTKGNCVKLAKLKYDSYLMIVASPR